MPLEAIEDPAVLRDIVGEVQAIEQIGDGMFRGAHRLGRRNRSATTPGSC